jgi:hypothetical protein
MIHDAMVHHMVRARLEPTYLSPTCLSSSTGTSSSDLSATPTTSLTALDRSSGSCCGPHPHTLSGQREARMSSSVRQDQR